MKTTNSNRILEIGYQPTGRNIVIEQQKRDLKKFFSESNDYWLLKEFEDMILAKCKNKKTRKETLRKDMFPGHKISWQILEDLKISKISPNQICERIIQIGKVKEGIIVGYCKGLLVAIHQDYLGFGKTVVQVINQDFIFNPRVLSEDK